jgi:hypothetical protein
VGHRSRSPSPSPRSLPSSSGSGPASRFPELAAASARRRAARPLRRARWVLAGPLVRWRWRCRSPSLAVAGLMVLSFARLLQVRPRIQSRGHGQPAGDAAGVEVLPSESSYGASRRTFAHGFLALPGVPRRGERPAPSSQRGTVPGGLHRRGSPPAREEDVPSLDYRMVSPGTSARRGFPSSPAASSPRPTDRCSSGRAREPPARGALLPGGARWVGASWWGTGNDPAAGGDRRRGGRRTRRGLDAEPGVTLYVPLPQVPRAVMVYARNMFWVSGRRAIRRP